MLNINQTPTNVHIEACGSMDEAQQRASSEAVNTSGTTIPGILFSQGGRYSFSAALSMAQVMDKLDVRSAGKNATAKQVGDATNRPTMPEHIKTISKYLKKNVNSKYIIPPLTLNVQQTMVVFSASKTATTSVAYAVLPSTAKLQVTDGSHRFGGICQSYEEMTDEERDVFNTHAVSVMIIFENDNAQVQQDFADSSKTKVLPPSLIAAYDRRNPANGIVLDLIDNIPLFNDKIDSTSKTLSKNSNMLFLVNHIRQYVKELLVGDWAMANAVFDNKATNQIENRNSEHYKKALDQFVNLTLKFCSVIKPWNDLINLERGAERMLIAQKRKEGWVSMTGTGLIILGRIGHVMIRDNLSEEQQNEVIQKLGDIDMSKNADYWQGNIMMEDRILSSRTPVRNAMKKILTDLGIGESELTEFEPSKQDNLV